MLIKVPFQDDDEENAYDDDRDAAEYQDVDIPVDEASDVELEMHVEVDLHALESDEDDLDLQDNNDDENNNDLMKDKFLSRDGRLWNPNCIGQRRKLRHNVFTVKKTGPTAETKDLNE